VVSNEARNGVILHGNNQPLLHTTPHHTTPHHTTPHHSTPHHTTPHHTTPHHTTPHHTTPRNGPCQPTTALQMPPVGDPASPWMWAKAKSRRGALIRLCGDGVVSNEARYGVILHGNNQPLPHTEMDRVDPPPRSRCPSLVILPRHGCGRRPEANEVH
jgi:hypothetical protein